ncbi:MAG TPA: M42 family metallopeptidase [Candidatus Limivivens merdigallinarum]|uniref:M42 family metallopeptidase n=1 Tax=Candidatus Limivivens merdigallinarum TaxID=2840859 RepID=A0A9D1D1C0_9FIRM|nr:M42 family metallopeptidase [Candidatus Limivivens merdigallinarum]
MKKYTDYILTQAKNLLDIDSPSGFTEKVKDYLLAEYRSLGYHPKETVKGGVLVDLGGEDDGLLLAAHVDTLGAMVAEIKSNGRLRLTNVGGMMPQNAETENCRVYTLDGRVYDGTCQLEDASVHVNSKYRDTERNYDTIEVLLDEVVKSKEDVLALGIMNGSFVCFHPRTVLTPSGFIKSRFLDDKLSTAILLGYAKYVKEEQVVLPRKVYQHITVFEEVGHGGCASVPSDVTEFLSVDMGCVGKGLECTEQQVSICVKDNGGPYHYHVVKKLIETARREGIDFAADIYPHYGSDADAALSAGADVRHGLIGPGVYASHGYERSHRDGVENTLRLIAAYLS